MNVKLMPAREVKVGMCIEVNGRWLPVAEVGDFEADVELQTRHGGLWAGDPDTLVMVGVLDEKEG